VAQRSSRCPASGKRERRGGTQKSNSGATQEITEKRFAKKESITSTRARGGEGSREKKKMRRKREMSSL